MGVEGLGMEPWDRVLRQRWDARRIRVCDWGAGVPFLLRAQVGLTAGFVPNACPKLASPSSVPLPKSNTREAFRG